MIPFSVLDLAPVPEGATPSDALRNTSTLPAMSSAWATGASGWPSTTT